MLEAAIFATIAVALVISFSAVLSWLALARHLESTTPSDILRIFLEIWPAEVAVWLCFFVAAGGLG